MGYSAPAACLTAMLFFPATALAELACPDHGFLQYSNRPTFPPVEQRNKFARFLVEPMKLLYSVIPDLPPDEARWLKTEVDAGGRRMGAAMATTAYHKQKAKTGTREIVDNLSLLLSSGSPAVGRQVGIWAFLARSYNDEELFRSVRALADQSVIDRQFAQWPSSSGPADLLESTCRLQANQILERIVIPYLFNALR